MRDVGKRERERTTERTTTTNNSKRQKTKDKSTKYKKSTQNRAVSLEGPTVSNNITLINICDGFFSKSPWYLAKSETLPYYHLQMLLLPDSSKINRAVSHHIFYLANRIVMLNTVGIAYYY